MKLYQDIWLLPVKTISDFVSTDNNKALPFIPILILAVSISIDILPRIMQYSDQFDTYLIILITVPLILVGILIFYRFVFPFMIQTSGLLWKGAATHKQLAKACSIALLPYSVVLVSQIIILGLSIPIDTTTFDFSARTIITCWSFILLVIGVAKSQQFTYGFAVLNIFMGYLPFILLLLMRL